MKTIATDNYDFKTLIKNGYAYIDKADRGSVTLIGINFSDKKRNIYEPLIESL